MSTDIKVPAMGESVTEATVARWFKKEGDAVKRDEPLLELETDKVTVEVPAPADGALESISVKAGDTVQVGALLGTLAEGKAGAAKPAAKAEAPKAAAPAAAPARNAATRQSGSATIAGVPAGSAMPQIPAANAPSTACPSAPTLNSPAWNGSATASPVKISGVALNSTCPMP